MFQGRFEWLVAWRYLQDPDRRTSWWLWVGIALGITGGLLAWLGHSLPAPESLPDPTHLPPALRYSRKIFLGGLSVAVLGVWVAIFGALHSHFRLFTTISIFGVFFGTQALIFVLSVMSGFEGNLRRSILGNNAHVVITRGNKPFPRDRRLEAALLDPQGAPRVAGLTAVAPFLKDEVILSGRKAHSGVYLKGIDPHNAYTRKLVGHNIRVGTFDNLLYPERLAYLAQPLPDLEDVTPPPGDIHPVRPTAPEERPAPPRPGATPAQPVPRPATMEPAPPIAPAGPRTRKRALPLRPSTATRSPAARASAPPHRAKLAELPGLPKGFPAGDPDLAPPLDGLSDAPPLPRIPPAPAPPKILPGIIVGRELARTLGVRLGDRVDVISTGTGDIITTGPMPRLQEFRVAGIFFSGHYEYDQKYAYVDLSTAQAFLRKPGQITGLELRTETPEIARAVAERIRRRLGPNSAYSVRPWQEINKAIFSALQVEKLAMFLVLVIIVVVAAFSIVANLIMVVTEKSPEIALLRSMGAQSRHVLHVFLVGGAYIGLIGMGVGVAMGIGLSLLVRHFGVALDPEVYYIQAIPVAVDPLEVGVVAGSVTAISVLAALFPALQAMRLRPVQGLRYK